MRDVVRSDVVFKAKSALRRAYVVCDTNKSGFISRKEFKSFFKVLSTFLKYYEEFSRMDHDTDRRVSFKEFKKFAPLLGCSEDEFYKMDANGGGFVLYDEFCAYMASKKHGLSTQGTCERTLKIDPNDKKVYLPKDEEIDPRIQKDKTVPWFKDVQAGSSTHVKIVNGTTIAVPFKHKGLRTDAFTNPKVAKSAIKNH